jgi:D-arabinose 1-dehydrogenase-like Zn-dependent alcohol dehydrogenase
MRWRRVLARPRLNSILMDCTQQGFVVAGSSASLQSIPVPTPKEGEAVVRVLIAGVCNTDLEIMKGATRS